jgi:hypothetical protein
MTNVCTPVEGVKLVVLTALVATFALLPWYAKANAHPLGLPVMPDSVMVSTPLPLKLGSLTGPVVNPAVAGVPVVRLTPESATLVAWP